MTSPGVSLRVGVASDVGLVREHNEDAAFAAGSVYLVADGMGGHAAGEVASAVTAEALGELAGRADLTLADLVAQVGEANERILARSAAAPEQRGMATTLTGIAVVRVGPVAHWAVFNLGDSRVYRYADEELRQITVDHSEVQELVDAGLLTPAEASVHPLRHTVTRSLGREYLPPVDTWVFPPTPGERFVVCSDGLTGEVSDARIAEILAVMREPQAAAEALVAEALAAGGRDNVTVIILAVAPPTASDVEENTVPRPVAPAP